MKLKFTLDNKPLKEGVGMGWSSPQVSESVGVWLLFLAASAIKGFEQGVR